MTMRINRKMKREFQKAKHMFVEVKSTTEDLESNSRIDTAKKKNVIWKTDLRKKPQIPHE